MDKKHSFKIYGTVAELPDSWNNIASANIFLGTDYLRVLEESAPENMECRFIGVFSGDVLCGVSISQFISLSQVQSFGERDNHFKTKIRHWFFKLFGANVLILGNNMLTGQNAFIFDATLSATDGLPQLYLAIQQIRTDLLAQGKKPHLTIFKDFYPSVEQNFRLPEFESYFQFSTQPNMVLTFKSTWQSFDDYLGNLTKKYRDHHKRARKKSDLLDKRKLSVAEIAHYSDAIYNLYSTVARNAPFNTFYLSRGHFLSLKVNLKDKFLFYGYFDNKKLIGFNTLIKNGDDIDTYFLGYDEEYQREKMLYLTMLYDMVGYTLNKGYKNLILGRTAIEIKSSIGAQPIKMIGFMRHCNPIFNYFLPRLFNYFEPDVIWTPRNPFKD